MPTTTTADRPEGLAIGDSIAVRFPGGDVRYYQITQRDRIFYRDAHSALAAGGTESYTSVENLDPPSGQIYQIYRVKIKGNVKLYVKQPAATNRFGTNKSPEQYVTDDLMLDGQIVNVWIIEDYEPSVQLVNSTARSITPIIYWIGWRYAIKKIEKPQVYTWITLGGISE